MCRVFKIALLVGSSSLACSQSVGALYSGHSVPALGIAVEYELEEFNQQANFWKSTTERIDRKGHHTLSIAAQKDQKDPVRKDPLPFPEPLPEPIVPRL